MISGLMGQCLMYKFNQYKYTVAEILKKTDKSITALSKQTEINI